MNLLNIIRNNSESKLLDLSCNLDKIIVILKQENNEKNETDLSLCKFL